MRRFLKDIIAGIIIVIIVFALFGRALSFGLVWDDNLFVKERYDGNIFHIIGESFGNGYLQLGGEKNCYLYYRPLTLFLFNIENLFFKGNPFGYHLVNLLLHLINIILFWRLVQIWTGRRHWALISAFFFAVFPLNPESVVWMSGRTDLLATVFILAALLYYSKFVLRHESPSPMRGIFITALFFVLSILSKETGYVLLFLLPLSGLLLDKRKGIIHIKSYASLYLTVLSTVLILIISRYIILKDSITGLLFYPNFSTWIFSSVAGLFKYSLRIFYPFNPDPYIMNPYTTDPFDAFFVGGLCLIAAAVVLFIALYKKNSAFAFFIAFLPLSFIPILNIIRIGSPLEMGFTMADRFTYLPSVAVCFLLAGLITFLMNGYKQPSETDNKKSANHYNNIYLCAVVICALYASINFVSAAKYADEKTFYLTGLKKHPDSHLLRFNLIIKCLKNGDYRCSEKHLARLKKYHPESDADLLCIEAILRYKSGKTADAIKLLNNALVLNPKNLLVLHNFGMLYLELDLPEEAVRFFESALKMNAEDLESKIGLALALQNSGNIDKAKIIYNDILSSNRGSLKVLVNYGNLLFLAGDPDNGEKYFKMALKANTDNPVVYYNYAKNLVTYTYRLDEALSLARKLMVSNPHYPGLYPLMSEIYFQKKEYDRALRWAGAGLKQPGMRQEILDILNIKVNELNEIKTINK